MKAVFEKIIERLEERKKRLTKEFVLAEVALSSKLNALDRINELCSVEDLVNQLAEEYATDINAGNNDSTKINQEPKTRIECLHSMSVEELADRILVSSAIVEIDFCQNISECDDITTHGDAIPDEMCKKCLMQWLNSPE